MSSARTDRRIALLLAGAALAAAAGPPPARADDGAPPPVFFRDPDRQTAEDIGKAIARFGDPSPNDRERARNLLFDVGYWTVPRLVDTMREKKSQFRTNAALVLMRLLDRRALPGLRAVVRDDEQQWPPAVAVLALGKYKDASDEGFGLLCRALAERDNDLRRIAACLALAKLHRRRGAECWPELEKVLDARAPKSFLESAAVLSLGFFRTRVAEPSPDGAGFVPTRRIKAALADSRSDLNLSAVLAMSIAYNNSFHDLFLKAWREGDRETRLAALLAVGRNRNDGTTDFLAGVLDNVKSNGEERQMAAYLLGRRPDRLKGNGKALDSLSRAATAGKASEVAAAAVVALAGVEDDRIADSLVRFLAAPSPTVRAAVAFGAVRLRRSEDLAKVREALQRRMETGEADESVRTDMKLAVAEIAAILKDREDLAKGIEPKPREAPAWVEVNAEDLFEVLSRDERQRTFDLVNLRVLEVLGIDGLFPYRPSYDPDEPASSLGGGAAPGASQLHDARAHNRSYLDQYDLRVELARRPYFTPGEDDPDAPAVALPRPR